MLKKARAEKAGEAAGAKDESRGVLESSRQIWLAGLGAFSRARDEGDGLFNTLVEQGKGLRERARGAADEALKTARAQADATYTQAQGQWDKLEQVFEERVSRSLNRLGVMTRQEIEDLSRQVEELNHSVQSLMKAQTSAKARSGTTAGKTATATPRKRGGRKASRKAKR